MKTAICYYSEHHGNTKKLVDAIGKAHPEVTLIDVAREREANLTGFDRIGFASGIYYGGFAKPLLSFMSINLQEDREVFFLYTCGAGPQEKFSEKARQIAEGRESRILGVYGCTGYDTYGPFKLVGGLKKGHPDAEEIAGAVRFYESLPGKDDPADA